MNERPGVRQGGTTLWVSDLENALRERVKQAPPAKLYVDEESGPRRDFGHASPRPERNDFAILRQVRDRSGLCHVHRVPMDGEACWDDVGKSDCFGYLAIQRYVKEAVVVAISDEQS